MNVGALYYWGLLRQKERTTLTINHCGRRTFLQLQKKFPVFYGTQKLFTILDVFTVRCVPQNHNIATNTISSVHTCFQNFRDYTETKISTKHGTVGTVGECRYGSSRS